MCALITEPRLETERLVLRPPRPEDAVYIADRINDWDVARMLARVPHPYSLADADGFIAARATADHRRERSFLIEHKAFGPVGVVGFHEQPTTWSETGCSLSPELGFWLGRSFWGQGLASEAVTAALDWAREAWGVRAAAAGHFVDNPASGRVLEKAGFLYTGEVQQRFCLARGHAWPTRMMVWLA